ncbi:MAG TPA: hypothetical protein VLA98_08840 [Solirubrobacteraceae bacterium]|nr:hypothetical protein [Solirubrobacteraceae bacterium]
MATTGTQAPSPQATLAWERGRRPLAGWSAIAAAALTLGGNVVISLGLRDLPKAEDRIVPVTDALRTVVDGRAVPPGRLSAQAQYLGEHVAGPIAGAVLVALGTLLLFLPLAYVFRAVRARRPNVGQWLLVLLAIGAVLYGVGNLLVNVARDLGAQDFASARDLSNSAAADALTRSPYVAGQILAQAGALALGFAIVITALNAMRAGLLTRFMGILGIIVGATVVLPLDQLGIIRSFWLAALGALILGRWPAGVPAAWTTGEAVAWPTQQQVREQRERRRREAAGGQAPAPRGDTRHADAAPSTPRPEPRTAEPHSSSKKKRRKRRS